MQRGLLIRAKITFNWTFSPHTHAARITVFGRRRSFQLTTIIFLTTLKNASVVMRRGFNVSAANCLADLCCPISSSACISLVCKWNKFGLFWVFWLLWTSLGSGEWKYLPNTLLYLCRSSELPIFWIRHQYTLLAHWSAGQKRTKSHNWHGCWLSTKPIFIFQAKNRQLE